MKKCFIILVCVFVLTLGLTAGDKKIDKSKHPVVVKKYTTCKHQPIVDKLITILKTRPNLKEALLVSLKKANRLEAPTLEEYYKYLDYLVTLIPTDRNLYYNIVLFYYLIDHPINGPLQKDDLFVQWTVEFANSWGSFLDTPASVSGIQTFLDDPDFHMNDYIEGPSGWQTFNQFFARELRPGKRPIHCLCDDRVIVAPADTAFVGCWKITQNSTIIVPGKNDKPYSIIKLLDGSCYADRFKGGKFFHAFLNVNDYHRYHVPVSGTVLEAREISGKVFLATVRLPDGSLHALEDTGYQFSQARGLVILDSPIGLVAVLPIGMAQVSSCNISVEVGDYLQKGDLFGYFTFGGSDIIVMFEEKCNANICMIPNMHYKQGRVIGYSGLPCPEGRPSCPGTSEKQPCPSEQDTDILPCPKKK